MTFANQHSNASWYVIIHMNLSAIYMKEEKHVTNFLAATKLHCGLHDSMIKFWVINSLKIFWGSKVTTGDIVKYKYTSKVSLVPNRDTECQHRFEKVMEKLPRQYSRFAYQMQRYFLRNEVVFTIA